MIINELQMSPSFPKTVKTHVSNILSKLAVSDRTQAVVYAFQHGLVAQEDQ